MHLVLHLVCRGAKAGEVAWQAISDSGDALPSSEFGWMPQENYISITKQGPRNKKQADRILISAF